MVIFGPGWGRNYSLGPFIFFLSAWILSLQAGCPVLAGINETTIRVEKVLDGDTFVTTAGQTIRLLGIDSPEAANDGQPPQYYAKESRKELRRLVRGVDLRMMNEKSEKDRYGRTLAVLTLPDGRILNRVLVQSGHAFFYPHGRTLDELDRVLLDDQRTAMASHRGFWGRILLRPEASQSFVGSEQSRRFHTSDCPYGKRINWKNRISFSTLREAFGAGYAPCRSCTPWPGE